jgi:hypothetical protein
MAPPRGSRSRGGCGHSQKPATAPRVHTRFVSSPGDASAEDRIIFPAADAPSTDSLLQRAVTIFVRLLMFLNISQFRPKRVSDRSRRPVAPRARLPRSTGHRETSHHSSTRHAPPLADSVRCGGAPTSTRRRASGSRCWRRIKRASARFVVVVRRGERRNGGDGRGDGRGKRRGTGAYRLAARPPGALPVGLGGLTAAARASD